MHFISLGGTCATKYQIDKKLKQPTHFFDWLGNDYFSTVGVFNSTTEELLNPSNFKILPESIYDPDPHDHIYFGWNYGCVSSHDLKHGETNLSDFISKYSRRHKRLLEMIKSNEKICFIRYDHWGDSSDVSFLEKSINNPNCLIFVLQELEDNIPLIRIKNKVVTINISLVRKTSMSKDWRRDDLDWDHIWEIITSTSNKILSN